MASAISKYTKTVLSLNKMHVWIQLVVKEKQLSKRLQPYLVLDCEKSHKENILLSFELIYCEAPHPFCTIRCTIFPGFVFVEHRSALVMGIVGISKLEIPFSS